MNFFVYMWSMLSQNKRTNKQTNHCRLILMFVETKLCVKCHYIPVAQDTWPILSSIRTDHFIGYEKMWQRQAWDILEIKTCIVMTKKTLTNYAVIIKSKIVHSILIQLFCWNCEKIEKKFFKVIMTCDDNLRLCRSTCDITTTTTTAAAATTTTSS